MEILNPLSESILKFLCNNIQTGNHDSVDIVFNEFVNQYSRDDIIAELEQLGELGYIQVSFDDAYESGYIVMNSKGKSYFRNKECRPTGQFTTVSINNSTGVNIGNNNTVNINDGISFEDVYELVDKLDASDKEIMKEIIDCLKDCLENSKPLPKSKFQKIIDATGKLASIFTAVGKLVFQHVEK